MAIEFEYKFHNVTVLQNTDSVVEVECLYATAMELDDEYTSECWAEFYRSPADCRLKFVKTTEVDIDEIKKSSDIFFLPSDYVIDLNDWVKCYESLISESETPSPFYKYIGSSEKFEEFEYYRNPLPKLLESINELN